MTWLARLKKQKGPDTHPTEPTKPGFVGFVGTLAGHIQKITGIAEPANDGADTWNVVTPAGTSPETIAKFRAASLALNAAQQAAGVPPLGDPDADCWPDSTAMTGAEIDNFTARLARFTDKGLTLDAGERLADKLVIRDRERDDRASCMECLHLHHCGRCGNWRRAGVAIRARDAQLPTDFVNLLQRCDGFADAVRIPRYGEGAARDTWDVLHEPVKGNQ